MNDEADALAAAHEDSVNAGRKVIGHCWTRMSEQTRSLLVASNYYSAGGSRQEIAYEDTSDAIDSLEYNLGVLKRCVDSTLPKRGEPNGMVPGVALTDEVLNSAGEILYERHLEPTFLRLALQAIGKHELANLLTKLSPMREDRFLVFRTIVRLLFGLLTIGLVLASPFLLGTALVSSTQGDVAGTVGALYGLGITALLAWEMKTFPEKSKKRSPDEIAYGFWTKVAFSINGPWLSTGAGLGAHLEDLLRQRVSVPAVAFDLCAALHRVVSSGSNAKPATDETVSRVSAPVPA